jgi:hypothetical protein
MAIKYVLTFSNRSVNGVEAPEKSYNQTVIEYVTEVIAGAGKMVGYNLDNCTAYPVQGMYKGVPEESFRLEYIVSEPLSGMLGFALWIKNAYKQESILLETYSKRQYKAELVYDIDKVEEL